MEGLDVDFAQSIVDFTSGACYAIDGDLKQISKYIFIATPEAVDLVGEFVDIKNKNENDTHTFDMSGSGFTKFNK
jgi:FtsZ-interacting cell division protein YlmF